MPTRIDIRGVIIPSDLAWIYDWFEIENTSPVKVAKALKDANGDDLVITINSPGGDVYAGVEIYTELKMYPANVETQVFGAASSAASLVALGGKTVKISPPGQIMIHNASVGARGDKNLHNHAADFLNTTDIGIANAYRLKTGKSQKEVLDMMNKETFMNAQDALKHGFVDEILFDEDGILSAVASADTTMIPQQIIDKFRNEFASMRLKGEVTNLGPENQQQNVNLAQVAPQAVDPATIVPTQQPAASTQQQPPAQQVPAAQAVPAVQQPAPANQVDQAAVERKRLQDIDAIATNIDPALVNEAKYGANPMTAEQLAFKAMNEGKMLNTGLFQQAVAANQAAGTGGVQPQPQQQGNDKEFDLNNLVDVNHVFMHLAGNLQSRYPQNMRRG